MPQNVPRNPPQDIPQLGCAPSEFLHGADHVARKLRIVRGIFRVTFHHDRPVKLCWEHHCQESLTLESAAPANSWETVDSDPMPDADELLVMFQRLFHDIKIAFGDVEFVVAQGMVSDVRFLFKLRRSEMEDILDLLGESSRGAVDLLPRLLKNGQPPSPVEARKARPR
jgi:hypothetical protein